ncbi:Mobile element protein [Candidatus Enterovibrio altilux]|uniref:Mobile element protein n=1 Tax=Candidatus Enterovibrio altilux TaxID=1927128 RepID=A0A291B7F6_9GAMM|nr:Mobile element protein [Candidatus Enterovibrio luxaltus]
MFRVKELLVGTLSLKNYNAQISNTYSIVKALNKLTGLGTSNTKTIV